MELRIYVANLAAYNDGRLIGEWIDLPMDEDKLQAKLDSIVKAHPTGEELAIHDHEAPFRIGEYDNITELNAIAERIEALDEEEHFLAVMEATSSYTPAQVLDIVEAGSYTVYDVWNLADLAEHFVDEGLFGDIPETIARYIDYEAIGRDLGHDGYVVVDVGDRRVVVKVD